MRYENIFDVDNEEWNGWGLSQSWSCIRKLSLKDCKLYQGDPLSQDTLRMFKLGNAAEDIMRVNHPEMVLTMQQFKVRILGRGGKFDGVIVDNGAREALVWENKSMNSMAFQKFTSAMKKGSTLQIQKPQYYAQCQCYMRSLQDMEVEFFGKPVVKTLFTVIERNFGKMHVSIVNFDNAFTDKVVQRIKTVNDARDNKRILGIPNNLESWECKYCDYFKLCKTLPKGEHEW